MNRHLESAAANYAAHIETLKARHDQALEIAGASHAVIFSGAPKMRFLDDNAYPFTANPHFVSWLPLTDTPYCYLVYTPGETPVLVYFQEKDYWHAPPAAPEGFWAGEFDVRLVHELDDVPRHLPEAREKCVLVGEIDEESQARGIERVNPSSLVNYLHYARAAKTPYELDCLRAASARGAEGHRAAREAFLAGKSEFEIHLDYLEATGHTEPGLPYGNIIALNEHGAILHYQHQSREAPARHRSFLIDAGARVNGYASDITRTHVKADGEFGTLIERMDELQLDIVGRVRAGIDFRELHIATHRQIAGVLNEFGLASGSADALIENGVTGTFYPHGLGHFLGIQVHDVGGFMAQR